MQAETKLITKRKLVQTNLFEIIKKHWELITFGSYWSLCMFINQFLIDRYSDVQFEYNEINFTKLYLFSLNICHVINFVCIILALFYSFYARSKIILNGIDKVTDTPIVFLFILSLCIKGYFSICIIKCDDICTKIIPEIAKNFNDLFLITNILNIMFFFFLCGLFIFTILCGFIWIVIKIYDFFVKILKNTQVTYTYEYQVNENNV